MPETTDITKLTDKQKILKHLEFEDLTLAWLSRKTDIPYGTLYSIFVENRIPLTQERLNLINIALKTKFELDKPA
jgi:predicted transcriptional regulator